MKILFVCKGNWFRSQMAEAVYNKLTQSNDASSAGTYAGAPDEPEGQKLTDLLPQDFFHVMQSHGLDLCHKKTKKLVPEMLKNADLVVSMAEEPFIPDFLRTSPKVIWWDVKDGGGTEPTYQKITELVQKLI